MVAYRDILQDIAVVAPTPSLILQLAEWAGRQRYFALRLIPAPAVPGMGRAWDAAYLSIVDATARPRDALTALDQALEAVDRGRLAVYSEIMHDGLEDRVREAGVPFWLGPMGRDAWASALDALLRSGMLKLGG